MLACGCSVRFVEKIEPACPTHGPQRVVRTVNMGKPRFRGHATGPHVEPVDLPAWSGKMVESE